MQNLFTYSLNGYILLSSVLFTIGILGILIRKNIIVIFMSVEIMLNAVNLLMTAFSVHHNNSDGQVFVFFIMAVAAAEVTIGLAILVMIYRNTGSVNIDELKKLKW
jgi:NADH-quinone oxidoreductase subunit K